MTPPRRGVCAASVLRGAVAALLLGGCGEAEVRQPPPPVGTEVGNTAPPLQGQLPGGESFSLSAGGDSIRIVDFYRTGDCGLCRVRLQSLQAHLEQYRSLGAQVVAVTTDSPAEVASTARQLAAGFSTVSVDTAALRRWGVLDTLRGVPVPATFIVDRDGVIRHRHVGRNAADRASDAGLLVLLERIRSGADAPPGGRNEEREE